MPGWVLISRNASSPVASSQRKSERDTPRQPSARCAASVWLWTARRYRVGDVRRQDVLRAAGRVFGLVVVEFEMVGRDDVDDVGDVVTDDAAGQLAPGNELLDHDVALAGSRDRADRLRRAVGAAARDHDADAGAFRDGLRHVRRRHDVIGEAASGVTISPRATGTPRPARSAWRAPCPSPSPTRARPSACTGSPSTSSRPWTQPSSPHRPCSALKQTSGATSASCCAR